MVPPAGIFQYLGLATQKFKPPAQDTASGGGNGSTARGAEQQGGKGERGRMALDSGFLNRVMANDM